MAPSHLLTTSLELSSMLRSGGSGAESEEKGEGWEGYNGGRWMMRVDREGTRKYAYVKNENAVITIQIFG